MRISDWSSDVCSSDLFRAVQSGLGWQLMSAHASKVAAALAACPNDRIVVVDGVNGYRAVEIRDRAEALAQALTQSGARIVASQLDNEIGRASCRERVCQSV